MTAIGPIHKPPTYLQPPEEPTNWFEHAMDKFFGLFEWMGGQIENFCTPYPVPPTTYELTPEQKTRIQELYIEALEILRKLEQPGEEDEVKEFKRLLIEFFRNRSKLLREEAACDHQTYNYSRQQVKEAQEKERAEFEKMIEDSKAKDFWNRVTGALTPLFTGIAGLFLPPGVNVMVVAFSIVLLLEELSDHAYTKTIAEMAAPDDREQREMLESRLAMGSSILGYAMAIPVGFGVTGALDSLKIVFGVGSATANIAKTTTQMSIQGRQSRITELTHKAEKNTRKFKDSLKSLQRTATNEQQTVEATLDMIEAQRKAIQIRGR